MEEGLPCDNKGDYKVCQWYMPGNIHKLEIPSLRECNWLAMEGDMSSDAFNEDAMWSYELHLAFP